MKNCPKCGIAYRDDMAFCLEDGTSLNAGPGAPAAFAVPDRKKQTGILPVLFVLIVVVGGLAMLGAAGVAGVWFYYRSAASVYEAEPERVRPEPTGELSDRSTLPDPADTGDVKDADAPEANPAANKPKKQETAAPAKPETQSKPAERDDKDTPVPTTADPPFAQPDRRPVPKQISGGVLNGKATSLPKPPYPPAARAVRAEGMVTVQVLVDEKGNVVSATATSGHPLLRSAAVSAARQAKFAPTMISGQPVKVSGVITYRFERPPAS
jgi:TonB family protein